MTTCEASDPMGTIKAVSFQEHGVDTVNSKKTFHFPRIILHDSLGNKLDTYTVLQEAIYRDKWNVKQTQEAKNSNEWRLPKAPPPAKPDLSRRGVPVSRPTRHRSFYYKDDLHIISRCKKETEAGDVDYVAKSLANLPSYLQTKFHDGEEMVGHRHYFQIAFGLFMEKRFISETIKKDSSYIFPGFCTGCKRSGLCYGCERSALPHTHRDYQSRTGGGFAYWKHDRAESEIDGNNPKNWRLHTTSSSGEPMSRTRSAATGGSSVEVYFVDGKKRLVLGHDHGVPLDDQTIEELCTMKIWDNIIDSDCDHVLYQDESGVEILIHKNNLQQILALMPLNHPDRQKILNLLDTESQSSKRLSITLDVASRLGTMTPSSLGGMSDEKGNLMDFIDSLERRSSSIDSKDEKPSTSRKGSLYKAPKAFKLKERERKQLIAQSPFSTNRQFDIPKGSGFNIKKSTKDLTQFVNVKRSDGNWEEPKKFELQKYERENNDFIRRQRNGDNKRNGNGHHDEDEEDRDRLNRVFNRLDAPMSPDSGLDSEFMADSVKGQTVDSDRDDITKMKSLDDAEGENGYFSTRTGISDGYSDFGREIGDHNRVKSGREETSGSLNGETEEISRKERKKREIIKKTRQIENVERPPMSRSPTKSLPTDDERELSFVFEKRKDSDSGLKDALRLPSPHVTMTTPDLPQIEQKIQEESKKKNIKYRVEAPPVMKQPPDPPKIRNPPPKIRTLPKMKLSKRRRKPAEAPVSAEGLKEIQDPLDFLAKYCIINPVRLPFYELIFEAAVLENKPEFPVPYLPQVNDDEPPVKHANHQQQSSLSQHEKTMIKDMTLVSHGLQPPLVGYSVPEQCLEKLSFTMQTLQVKKEEMEKKLVNLEAKRINILAELAREEFPGIDGMIYSPRKKKGKQKKPEPTSPVQDEEITNETIIKRLDKKSLAQLCSKEEIRHVDIEIQRIHQKVKDVTIRQNQLKDERNMLLGYCEDDFVNRQFTERHSNDFRRQQSELYNTLRPTPDYEITLDNLRESLQQVNNHLLTDRECEFLYQVLDLPGREKINFRLFSVVAALSEKVTQLDPMIRRLMNKHDYKALDIKMEKCRELFSFLEDDIAPPGEATATSLALELTAGGLTPEHTSYVLGKFNREGRGLIDFMDFVTYVPLFVEIHQRIIKDPLSEDQDL